MYFRFARRNERAGCGGEGVANAKRRYGEKKERTRTKLEKRTRGKKFAKKIYRRSPVSWSDCDGGKGAGERCLIFEDVDVCEQRMKNDTSFENARRRN